MTPRRTHLFLLGLVLALATGLRCFNLAGLGFWSDELYTLSCADGYGLQLQDGPRDQIAPPQVDHTRVRWARPFSRIAPAMAASESHPPLYPLMLRPWLALFGDDEVAVRSLGVVFSLAAIVLLYVLAHGDVGAGPALWACLLMAVATPQVQFAQEARGYVPAMTFCLAGAVSLRALARRPTWGRVALLASALLAMMLTHYLAAGVAVALAAQAALVLRGRARRLAVVAFVGAAVLFVVLWGPSVWQQRSHVSENTGWLDDAGPGHAARVLRNACRLPVRWVADGDNTATVVAGAVLLLAVPVVYLRRPALRVWILWLACAAGAVVVMDLARDTKQLTLIRYTLLATPAVYVLLAAAVPGRWGAALPALAVVLALLNLRDAYVPAWKTDLRTPVQQMASAGLNADDGLVVAGPPTYLVSVTFAAFERYLPRMPRAAVILTRPADAQVLRRLNRCPRVWVVWMWPDRPITSVLPGFRSEDQGSVPYFGDVAVGRFAAPGKADGTR